MTTDYLAVALAYVPQRDKSDISDQRQEPARVQGCDISDKSDKKQRASGLLSHRSLMSQEQREAGRRCITCAGPLPADRIEQCRGCSAAVLRQRNPALAEEIYGQEPVIGLVGKGGWAA